MTAPQPPAVWWSPTVGLIEMILETLHDQQGESMNELPTDAVRLVAVASGLPVWTVCPTCSSSRPHLHPTADLCPDSFHRPEPATADEWRSEVVRWADLLSQIGQLPAGTGLDAVARIVADMRREAAVPASAALDGTSREPDDVDDGVEWWFVGADLDIARDATSAVSPPTYRIGARHVSAGTLRIMRDALTAALAADTPRTDAQEG